MNLKSIGKRVQEKFLGKNEEKTLEEVVKEEVIEPIQDENTELTSSEIATQIIELLNKNPANKRKEIIQELRKSDVISSDILIESAVKAADSDEVPDKLAVELATQASDKTAVGILKNAEISETDRLTIIKTLADNKLKEEAICTELKMIYGALKGLRTQNVLAEKINSVIGIVKRTDNINNELYKVIAKNFAITYRERNGGMSLYQMEQVVPIHEMIREQMPERIEAEYEKLLKSDEENKFDLQEVKERFMEQMVKETHEKAEKEEQPESTLMKYLGEVSDEQTEILTKYIRKYNPSVKQKEIDKCLRIAKGEESESIYESKKENKKNSLAEFSQEKIEIIEECINSGLINTLSQMNEQERKKSLVAINSSLEKRIQKEKHIQMLKDAKVAPQKDIPKVKKAEFKGDIDR